MSQMNSTCSFWGNFEASSIAETRSFLATPTTDKVGGGQLFLCVVVKFEFCKQTIWQLQMPTNMVMTVDETSINN